MTTKPANPFVLGKYLNDDYFCDRVEETAQLRKYIVNGHNIVLISPRRMGKSGLIHHFFARKEVREEFYTAFADIYATKSLSEFVYLLANAIYASIKGGLKQQTERFFRNLASIRVGFKIDAVTGEPVLDLQPGQVKSPRATLDELFAYIEGLPRPVIIAIDEFQQIGEYPETTSEALLRTYIQNCKNAQFIFAGSKRHMLANMFLSYAKPFYQSATLMNLGKIDVDKYCEFAMKLFAEYGKKTDGETVRRAYERGEGITWYYQAIMNQLFADTESGGECGADKIEPAVNSLITARTEYYLDTLSHLSDKQKGLLIAIARAGVVTSPTSAEFIGRWGLGSASSVQSAMRALLKNDIVTKEQNTYLIPDIFFAEWLRTY